MGVSWPLKSIVPHGLHRPPRCNRIRSIGHAKFDSTATATMSPRVAEALLQNTNRSDLGSWFDDVPRPAGTMANAVNNERRTIEAVDAYFQSKDRQNLPRLEIDPAVPAGKVIVTDRTGQASVTMTVL